MTHTITTDGSDAVPVDVQARQHTGTCLTKLLQILKNETGKQPDPRLQFWIARYLLELGHGRAPVRRAAEQNADLTPDEERKLEFYMSEYDRLQRIQQLSLPAPRGEETAAGETVP